MCRSGGKDAALQDGGRVEDYNANCLPENPPFSSSLNNLDNMFSATSVSGATCSPRCLTILPPDLLSGVQLVIFGVDMSLFATFGLLCNSLGQDVFYWANFDFSNYGDQ